jgi:hypothetical protein
LIENLPDQRAVLLVPAGDDARRQEFESLAASAGADVADTVTAQLRRPDPRTLIRSGKLEELQLKCAELAPSLLLVDFALSPSQERNLERALKCRVVDRTSLILDIFALRARSREGKLQVELPSSSTCPPAWWAAGPTLSGKRAASDCAALAKPSWRPTDAWCPSESGAWRPSSPASWRAGAWDAPAASVPIPRSRPWPDTPTSASPRSSTAWPAPP